MPGIKGLRQNGKGKSSFPHSFASIIAIIMLVILSACGFTPVHSKQGDNEEVARKLASIYVKPIKTLLGQEYVNTLEDILDPSRTGTVKEYEMEVVVSKDVSALAIERDRTITRYKVAVTANYTLKEIASGKIISSGIVRGSSEYDKVDSDYATYVSENDTTNRAIRELAQDTKIRIMSALIK